MSNIILSQTSVAGNANADFTVPASKTYRILYGHAILTTDATVANRYVTIAAVNGATTIYDTIAGAPVAASGTSQHHEFMQGIYRESAFINNTIQAPIPQDFILSGGWTFRVNVENGVAGDSYDVHFIAEVI